MEEIKIPIDLNVSEALAIVCMGMVEIYLNGHPDHDMRVSVREDGTTRYRLVKKDEPCCD